MAFVEDFTPYRDTNGFADEAMLGGEDVRVIFDAQYIDPLGVESTGPIAELTNDDADIGGAAHGVALIITTGLGVGTWKVRGVQPNLNSPGWTVLKLERQ